VLGTTKQSFKHVGEALAEVAHRGTVAVVASPDAIAKANSARPGILRMKEVLKGEKGAMADSFE
jgi:hypothetical protein